MELCKRLKFYPTLAPIPAVMTSGEIPPEEKCPLWNVFFSKPVDLGARESGVYSLLARRLCGSRNRVNVPPPAPSRWAPMAPYVEGRVGAMDLTGAMPGASVDPC